MSRSFRSMGSVRNLSITILVILLAAATAMAQDSTLTTLVTSSATTLGSPVVFTATVTDTTNPGVDPTGSVFFFANDVFPPVLMGSGPLSGGALNQATFTTSVVPVGTHNIQAVYESNAPGTFSTSNATALQVINPRAISTVISLATPTVTVRNPGTSTVSVTVTDASGNNSGTFAANNGDATCTVVADGNCLQVARQLHAASLLPSGDVLIVGGLNSGATVEATAEVYSASGGTFGTLGSSVVTPRAGATATLLQNGTVLITGGTSTGAFAGALNTAEIYDPVANTFTAVTNTMVSARFGHTATLLPNGNVLLVGGEDTTGAALSSTEVFTPGATPTTGTFATGNPVLSTPRFQHTATLLRNGLILITGGETTDNSTELINTANTGTTASGNTTSNRTGHVAVLLPDGNVLLAGGSTTGLATGAISSAELYDQYAGTFVAISATTTPATGRDSFTATLLNNATVLITGGIDNTSTTLNTAELYSPSYDPQGTVSLSSTETAGVDSFTNCTLVLSGTGTTICNTAQVTANHFGSGSHKITGSYISDWAANTAYAVNALILPTNATDNAGGFLFEATVTGTSAATEPSPFNQTFLGTTLDPAGTGPLTWTNVGLSNHSTGSTSTAQTLTVNTQAITITAASDTKSYDGTTTSSGTPTITSAVPPITPGPLLGSDTFTNPLTQVFTSRNATTVGGATLTPVTPITISNGGNDVTADYTITDTGASAQATGTINQLGITVTAVNNSKTYDRTTSAAATPTFTALASGDTTTTFIETYNTPAAGTNNKTLTPSGVVNDGNGGANYSYTYSPFTTGTISQLGITETVTATNKTYDRTATATITNCSPVGVIAGDAVTCTAAAASFPSKAAGNGLTVTATGITLSGADGGNYSPTATETTTANMTPLGITETVTATNKTYDRTATATITNCSPVGVIAGDAVTCTAAAASFPSKAAGNGLTVTAMGITLSGADGGNYSPTATETTTANITPLGITETVTAANKTYDQTATATITNCSPVGVIAGDTVTCTAAAASFPSKVTGNNLTVTATGITLGGTDGANYAATATETTTATISQLSITETVTAANKTYDRTATATINTCSPNSVFSGDVVTCSSGGATFPSKAAGSNLTVTATGITLGGGDGGNYSPTATETTTATINQLGITETVAATNKTYDQTATATITNCSPAGVIAGDTVTCTAGGATFPSKAAGSNLTVTATGITLGGGDGGNYSPTATETTTATINQLSISETVTAANKTYDRTATATISNCAPNTVFSGDVVTCSAAAATFPSKVAGSNLTVTATGITLGGGDGGNYSPTATETTTATINQLGITETVTAVNKTYDRTATATINTCTPNGVIAGDAVTCSTAAATFPSKAAGSNLTVTATGITLGGGDGGNYSPTATETTTATITQLGITEAVAATNKTYDGTTTATINTCTPVGTIAGDTVTCAASSATFATRNVGNTLGVTATGIALGGGDGANYSPTATEATTANITQLALTVTAATNTKTYDGNTSAGATPAFSALGASDTLTPSSPTPLMEVYTSKGVGSGKALVPSGRVNDGNGGNNYTYTYVNDNSGVINALTISSSATANNKPYDGGLSASLASCAANGALAGDSVTCSVVGAAASFVDKNVGNAKTVNVTGLSFSGADSGDYTIPSGVSTTANITARTLTVTATATNKVYDATVNASTNLSDNRIPGDQLLFTSNASFTDKNVGNGKTVNITAITINGGADQGNYVLSSSSTTATANITQASLTVTASGSNKVYDGTNSATVTLSDNRVTGDSLTDSFANATFPDKMVGVGRVVSVSGISISGADFGNYNLTSTTATTSANITQRPITITAAADTKTYDGSTVAATAPTVTSGSLATGDTGAFTETYSTKTAGTSKMLNPAAVINDGNGGNNYLVTPTSANVGTINPLAIAGSITASNKVYDTTNTATISCAPAGVIPPDQVNCTATAATFSDKNVGNAKTVTASGVSLSGADAGNYSASMTSTATASITPASLTVSAGGVSKVYDGTNTATVMLTDNHLGTDNVVDNFGTATFSDKNVGTVKQVSVGGISISGGDAGNYTLTNVTAVTSANITPRALVVSATGVNKVFDATTTATVTLSDNRVTGDSLTDSFATAAFAGPNVGTGIGVSVSGVAISGTDANNYSANASAATTAAITPATTTSVVTVPDTGNAAEFTFAATVSPQIAGTPTGSVTFMDNGTPLGAGASGSSTVPLTNGAASFTLLVGQLGSGQHNITAVYSKDANFAAATTQVPAGVTVAATLSVSPGAPIAAQNITLSNPTGQSVTYTNLKCSVLSSLGAAVANTLCSVNPASVTVPANGTASIAVDLATNSAATATLRMNGLSTLWMAMPAVVFLPLAAPASIRRRLLRRKLITILGLTLLLAALMFSIGCGGGGFNNPTPLQPGSGTSTTTQPGSYVVQISGTGANGQVSLASIPMTVGF